MVQIIGESPREKEPEDAHVVHLEELLDRYASATQLHAGGEAGAVRGEIVAFFANHRLLQDGEFICEGVLFGAFFRARGRMTAAQYRNPVHIVEFLGQLVSRLVTGIDRFMESQARRLRGPEGA